MNLKAILLGFLAASLLSTIVVSVNNYLVVLLIPVIFESLSSGLNWITAYFTVTSFLIHAGFYLLGGYITGRTAKRNEYWHAGVVAIISIIANFGLSFWLAQRFNYPMMSVGNLIKFSLTTIPYAMVGAHLAHIKNLNETTKS